MEGKLLMLHDARQRASLTKTRTGSRDLHIESKIFSLTSLA